MFNLRETAAAKAGQAFKEANRKKWEGQQKLVTESLRKQIRESYGVDISEAEVAGKLDFMAPDFSIKKFQESVYKVAKTIKEANAEGMLQQFLRAGVQLMVNKDYQAVEVTMDKVYQHVPSNKAVELYAPAYRGDMPQLIGPGEEPQQAKIGAADIQIPNTTKAAKLFVVTKEMLTFDQTNQVREQAQQIAENMPIHKDSIAAGRWLSKASTVLDAGGNYVSVSATGTQAGESTWPWNASFTNGGGQNRLSAYAAATYRTIIQLRALAKQMKDPLGRKMLVNPKTLICGVGLSDGFKEMLESDLWPSTASITAVADGGAAGTDMTMGAQHAKNILKGEYDLVESIWLPNTCYGIMQAGKGFLCQQVWPVEVVTESPVSGPSFSAQMFRQLISEFYTIEWREPRFAVLGSDGTV